MDWQDTTTVINNHRGGTRTPARERNQLSEDWESNNEQSTAKNRSQSPIGKFGQSIIYKACKIVTEFEPAHGKN